MTIQLRKLQSGGTIQEKFFSPYTPFQAGETQSVEYTPDQDNIVPPQFIIDRQEQEQEDAPNSVIQSLFTPMQPYSPNDNISDRINNIVNYLTTHAANKSTGYCARSIRKALEHGGLNLTGHPNSAYLYNGFLGRLGFQPIGRSKGDKLPSGYVPKKGDIIVIGQSKSHPHGHIAMYNGHQWISDFKQKTWHGLINMENNDYTIWRY